MVDWSLVQPVAVVLSQTLLVYDNVSMRGANKAMWITPVFTSNYPLLQSYRGLSNKTRRRARVGVMRVHHMWGV